MADAPKPSAPPMITSNGRPLIIAVIGGGDPPPRAMELAEEVGRELAKRGVMVVCGGRSGVMEAVCRGSKAEGGTTIGILPGNEAGEANDYIDIPIPVIGLETWELPHRADLPMQVMHATSPVDAVERAIAAAHERDAREQSRLH